uniref:Kelch domain-containing protein 10 n=1 Tax=Parastrongyloides trichosuri TaxID=131310 RepID=A0A0N4ZKJ5_PARTI
MPLRRHNEIGRWRNFRSSIPKPDNCICLPPVKFHVKKSYDTFNPRSGHTIVCTGTNFYIIGGYCDAPETGIFNEINMYNKHTNTIQRIPISNLPTEILSNAAINFPVDINDIEDSILMFGGTGIPFSENISDKLYWIRKTLDKWDCVACTNIGESPNKRYGCCMIFDHKENCIYISGGTDGFNYFSDIWKGYLKIEYDITNKIFSASVQWELLLASGFPHDAGVYKHKIVLHDNILWSFGGGNTTEIFSFQNIPTFNLLTGELRIRGNIKGETNKEGRDIYPISRKCFGSCEYVGKLFICGGQGIQPDPNPTESLHVDLNDIWYFDFNEIKWTRVKAVFLHPCYFNSCDVDIEGTMVSFGGVNKRRSRNNNLYKINLAPKKLVSLTLENVIEKHEEMFRDIEVLSDKYDYNYHLATKDVISKCHL